MYVITYKGKPANVGKLEQVMKCLKRNNLMRDELLVNTSKAWVMEAFYRTFPVKWSNRPEGVDCQKAKVV